MAQFSKDCCKVGYSPGARFFHKVHALRGICMVLTKLVHSAPFDSKDHSGE